MSRSSSQGRHSSRHPIKAFSIETDQRGLMSPGMSCFYDFIHVQDPYEITIIHICKCSHVRQELAYSEGYSMLQLLHWPLQVMGHSTPAFPTAGYINSVTCILPKTNTITSGEHFKPNTCFQLSGLLCPTKWQQLGWNKCTDLSERVHSPCKQKRWKRVFARVLEAEHSVPHKNRGTKYQVWYPLWPKKLIYCK